MKRRKLGRSGPEAYGTLVEQGKVCAIGCSNYDQKQLRSALDASAKGLPPECNLLDRAGFKSTLRDLCIQEDLGVITYYSLASGFLSGKFLFPFPMLTGMGLR